MTEKRIIYETHATGHWKELFASKNKILGGHNLEEGEELCATIDSVGTETVYDAENKGNKEIVVLHFKGGIPPMALNVTNADTIAMMHGNTYPDWVGKKILIHTAKVKAFGKVHDALRVRPVIPRDDDISGYEKQIMDAQSMEELKAAFLSMPKHVQGRLSAVKDKRKGELS